MSKPVVSPFRQVIFFDDRKASQPHPHAKAMKARIDTREGRLLHGQRPGIAGPFFGHLHTRGLRRFTLRSRRKADAQSKRFAIVHNIQKLQG